MRKPILLFSLISIVVIFAKTDNIFAQKTKVGGGISFGTGFNYHNVHSGYPGINVTGKYKFSESIQFTPGFTFYFSRKDDFYDDTRSTTVWLLDLDGHYYIKTKDRFSFYALGGLNITGAHSNYKGDSPELYPDYSDQKIGLNIGAGVNMAIDEMVMSFGEIRYIIGLFDQLTLTAGVIVPLKWFEK